MKREKFIERQSLLCHWQSKLLLEHHDNVEILEDIYEATGRLSFALSQEFNRLEENSDENWEDIYNTSPFTNDGGIRGRVRRIMYGFINEHGGV